MIKYYCPKCGSDQLNYTWASTGTNEAITNEDVPIVCGCCGEHLHFNSPEAIEIPGYKKVTK